MGSGDLTLNSSGRVLLGEWRFVDYGGWNMAIVNGDNLVGLYMDTQGVYEISNGRKYRLARA